MATALRPPVVGGLPTKAAVRLFLFLSFVPPPLLLPVLRRTDMTRLWETSSRPQRSFYVPNPFTLSEAMPPHAVCLALMYFHLNNSLKKEFKKPLRLLIHLLHPVRGASQSLLLSCTDGAWSRLLSASHYRTVGCICQSLLKHRIVCFPSTQLQRVLLACSALVWPERLTTCRKPPKSISSS